MVSIGVSVVSMMSIPVPVVSQTVPVVMAVVGISLSLGLGFSVSSDSCEKAESGNSLEIRGVRGGNTWYDPWERFDCVVLNTYNRFHLGL